MGTAASDMLFIVSVPVLSTHKTVAAPSASIAGRRRVSTRLRAIRQAPDVHRPLPLHDHMIREHRRQSDVCEAGERKKEKRNR